jgi:hypothetical protein
VDSYGTHRRGDGQSSGAEVGEPLGFRSLDALFLLAENQIALLRRCQPANGPAELARWSAAFARGQAAGFAWKYAPAPNLGRLKAGLERVERACQRGPVLDGLYAERARELRLDAELAERIGTAEFHALARRRQAALPAPRWAAARALARHWAEAFCPPPATSTYASDDRSCAHSLLTLLTREIGQRRLPVRVEVVSSLASRAASGDGIVFIQADVWLSRAQAERIALHEVLGHALPRVRARWQSCGLFRVGSAGAGDDEEGRALAIEERLQLLDAERRRELGLRHLAALAVAEGADASECVRLLLGLGCALSAAASVYARVARGGGLCRELVYLPAWLNFKALIGLEPDLERWLEHGRISLVAARTLREAGIMPTESDLPELGAPGVRQGPSNIPFGDL